MRLVLDTDVFLAGTISRLGASRVLLRCGLDGRLQWLMSPALFLEYEAVLMRTENLAAANLSSEEARIFLSGIAEAITPVSLNFIWRPQLKDPADEMVLETAVNGVARYLVTFNKRHFSPATERFGIKVISPGALLTQYQEILQ